MDHIDHLEYNTWFDSDGALVFGMFGFLCFFFVDVG